MIFIKFSKFHDISRFSRCTLIFPGFPGRVGTLNIFISTNTVKSLLYGHLTSRKVGWQDQLILLLRHQSTHFYSQNVLAKRSRSSTTLFSIVKPSFDVVWHIVRLFKLISHLEFFLSFRCRGGFHHLSGNALWERLPASAGVAVGRRGVGFRRPLVLSFHYFGWKNIWESVVMLCLRGNLQKPTRKRVTFTAKSSYNWKLVQGSALRSSNTPNITPNVSNKMATEGTTWLQVGNG